MTRPRGTYYDDGPYRFDREIADARDAEVEQDERAPKFERDKWGNEVER